MLPLWTGALPAGIAYSLAAHAAGLGMGETQLMSLVVFSATAQLGTVSLLGGDTPLSLLLGTAMALNAQLLLLGLVVGRQLRLTWSKRLVAAWFLTDAAYGIAATRAPLRLPVLLGAGVSMYLGWNLGTALGILAGHIFPDLRQFGLDFVATLAFLAVLVPLVQTRTAALVALGAGLTTVLLQRLVPGGVAALLAGVVGIGIGAWWTREPIETGSNDPMAHQPEEA
jgi:predicted branched-subunit amino acid permease